MLGTLSALSDLEKKASDKQKETAKAKYHQRVQHSQLEKIKQLQHRRDELLNLLCTKADAETRKINGETEDTDTQDEDSVASALNYVTELKEKLQMYKMTGVCVVKTDPDSKVLSFTTSYKGTYLESYHLKLQRLASGTFKVIHHDLPAFIVYATLPDNLEVKDMPSAVRPLQEALSMFVLRREELERAQNKFGDSLQIRESSAALDHLCCHLDIGNSVQVEITLKYPDLKHYLPSSVKTVLLKQGETQREEIPQDIADSVQSTFYSNDLYTALSTTANTMLNYCDQDGQ